MNARKNVRSNMIAEVIALFQTDVEAQTAYKYAPALAEDVADLTAVNEKLEASLEKAEVSTSDLAAAQKALRATITKAAKKMIAGGNAHAAHKNDKQLKDQLTAFGPQIDKAKNTELPLVCNNLMKQLFAIPAEDLAKRGIEMANKPDFEGLVAQFKNNGLKNKGTRGAVSTEINLSEALTNEGCAIVYDRIAPTLLTIKDMIPAFYPLFEKAATVRKPATTTTQLKVVTLDGTTDATLEGATITNPMQSFAAKTALKGEATLKNDKKAKPSKSKKVDMSARKKADSILKTDTLLITHDGYLPHELPMPSLKRGKITTITVRLMPDPAFRKMA